MKLFFNTACTEKLICKTMSKTMKNLNFFVTYQQKSSKRKLIEDVFTEAILIVCGCLEKRHIFCPSLALTLREVIKGTNRSN